MNNSELPDEWTIEQKKLWLFFQKLRRKDKFKKYLEFIREKYQIETEKIKDIMEDGIGISEDEVYFKHSIVKTHEELETIAEDICNHFNLLDYLTWYDIIIYEVFNGMHDFVIADSPYGIFSTDLDELTERAAKDYEKIKRSHPVIIMIPRHVVKSHLIDYIKKYYEYDIGCFLPPEDEVTREIRNAKTRNKTSRNDRIYQLRNEETKQIADTIYEEFEEALDESHITTIILQEVKKRS